MLSPCCFQKCTRIHFTLRLNVVDSEWCPYLHRGGSRIFFRRGCTRLELYFNTNKPHSFFFGRIPVVLENRRSSRRGGGVRTPCTLPLDPPLLQKWKKLISKGSWLIVYLQKSEECVQPENQQKWEIEETCVSLHYFTRTLHSDTLNMKIKSTHDFQS